MPKIKKYIFLIFLGLIINILHFSSALANFSYYNIMPTKGSVIAERRPLIKLPIILNNHKILNFSVEVDNIKVPAFYDENENAIIYKPEKNLSLGLHKINATLEVSGLRPVSISSDFIITISPQSPFEDKNVNMLSSNEREILAYINSFRKRLNIPVVLKNYLLTKSAQSHSNYLLENNEIGHEEIPANNLYTGKFAQNRVTFWGYPDYASEVISGNVNSLKIGCENLIDAPYHRISIINPKNIDAGMGYNIYENDETVQSMVVNFGTKHYLNSDEIILYPYPGQSDSKISWFVNEIPNPLRYFKKDKIYVGYPISFSVYDNNVKGLIMANGYLKDIEANEIPFYLIDSRLEVEHKKHIFIIPQNPLKPGMSYTVYVKAFIICNSGEMIPIERKWSFTTKEKIEIFDTFIRKIKNIEIVGIQLKNGDIPNLEYTLMKNGKIIRTITKDKIIWNTQNLLETGNYILKVKSSFFPEEEFNIKIIEDNNKKECFLIN